MSVELITGRGGLPLVRLEAMGGAGEIFLHGAHLASWAPTGQHPVLWMSESSRFANDAPIRGGVPLCFPWFGTHPSAPDAPLHGFARLSTWDIVDTVESASTAGVVLRLTDSHESRRSVWPHRFEAFYTVVIGDELRLTLEIVNLDSEVITFDEVLHSYYHVGDINDVRVTGLENLQYVKSDSTVEQRDTEPLLAHPGIGRRYSGVTAATIEDAANDRHITVRSENASDSVVWNPGQEIARGMDDFDNDGWNRMLCLENGNIGRGAVRITPGERHRMHVTVAVGAGNSALGRATL